MKTSNYQCSAVEEGGIVFLNVCVIRLCFPDCVKYNFTHGPTICTLTVLSTILHMDPLFVPKALQWITVSIINQRDHSVLQLISQINRYDIEHKTPRYKTDSTKLSSLYLISSVFFLIYLLYGLVEDHTFVLYCFMLHLHPLRGKHHPATAFSADKHRVLTKDLAKLLSW